jgi:SPP1 gp7 family putative phage head morphogenesis protein
MGILLDAFRLPPVQAIAYLREKDTRMSGDWHTVWKEQHQRVFTVANLFKMDLLQDVRDLIDRAVAGTLTTTVSGEQVQRAISFSTFKAEFRRRVAKLGWTVEAGEVVDPSTGEIISHGLGTTHRLRTIYHANVQTALNAGRYRGQMEAAADLPYWRYVAVMDGDTTDKCRSLNGRVFRAGDPVWDTIYPPNHWGCRSRVRALTGRMVERDGLDIESSDGRMVTKQEVVGGKKEGRLVTVNGVRLSDDTTFWPDPGWDYNPGKTSFKPDLSKYSDDIAALYKGIA